MTDMRSSSLFELTWQKETSPAFKEGSLDITFFNPDISPLQPPCIRYGWVDTMNSEHRERIGQFSKFLQKQVLHKFQELNHDGWKYVPKAKTAPSTSDDTMGDVSEDGESNKPIQSKELGEKKKPDIPKDSKSVLPKSSKTLDKNSENPTEIRSEDSEEGPDVQDKDQQLQQQQQDDSSEWDDELKEAAALATYYGAVVDTSFLLLFRDRKEPDKVSHYLPVSRNWIRDGKVYGNDDRLITGAEIKFPQWEKMYKEGKDEPFVEDYKRIYTQFSTHEEKNAVVIQPRWIITDPFGECILKAELITALEKMYLRFYEMLSLHKGGILSETYVMPKGVADDVARRTKAEMLRGMGGFGRVLKINAAKDIKEQFIYEATPMGKLDFATIASHINQDVDLSKQAMEGGGGEGAGPNPFTGINPLMNEQSDKKLQSRLSDIYKQVIKDINYVIFDKDPETYDIEFNKPMGIIQNQVAKDEVNRNERKEEQIKSDKPQAAFGKGTGKQPNRQSRGF